MVDSAGVLGHMGADAQALVKRAWWVFIVGGVAMVVFGVLAFASPGIALFALATFFAASVLVDSAHSWSCSATRSARRRAASGCCT